MLVLAHAGAGAGAGFAMLSNGLSMLGHIMPMISAVAAMMTTSRLLRRALTVFIVLPIRDVAARVSYALEGFTHPSRWPGGKCYRTGAGMAGAGAGAGAAMGAVVATGAGCVCCVELLRRKAERKPDMNELDVLVVLDELFEKSVKTSIASAPTSRPTRSAQSPEFRNLYRRSDEPNWLPTVKPIFWLKSCWYQRNAAMRPRTAPAISPVFGVVVAACSSWRMAVKPSSCC